MGWFSDLFGGRTESPPKQGFFEGNSAYRDRVYREGKERIIEDTTGSAPRPGFFESDDRYRGRIVHEANERIVERATDKRPRQGFFESEPDYSERIHHETNARIVEGATGSAPRQGFFEGDESYRERISRESDARIVESATGSAPRQGFFESDDSYQARVNREAKDVRASERPAASESGGSSYSYESEETPEPVSEDSSYLYDDDDDWPSPYDDESGQTAESAAGADRSSSKVSRAGRQKPRGLESLWEIFSEIGDLQANGGRRVVRNEDGSIELTTLSGGSSSFNISTMRFESEKEYERHERMLAEVMKDYQDREK